MAQEPKFKSVKQLKTILDKYFKDTPINQLTLTGLVLAADTNKVTFNAYAEKKGFDVIIRNAKLRVENSYEMHLKEKNSTGSIFALKNFGWIDKQERKYTGDPDTPIEIRTRVEISEEDKNLIEEMKNRSS